MENNEINNGFDWQKWKKDRINDSIGNLEKGAEKLEKLIGFFWTSYIVFYGVGGMFVFDFTKYDKVPFLAVFLLALPIFTLMLSFWFCYKAQMPIIKKIKGDIQDIFNEIVNKKTKRLESALNWALFSAIFMASGLFALFIAHPCAKM